MISDVKPGGWTHNAAGPVMIEAHKRTSTEQLITCQAVGEHLVL